MRAQWLESLRATAKFGITNATLTPRFAHNPQSIAHTEKTALEGGRQLLLVLPLDCCSGVDRFFWRLARLDVRSRDVSVKLCDSVVDFGLGLSGDFLQADD